MKKALSSLLVFALVLTLLVPAFAFAADKTTEEKFNELKELGLLNGVEDGSAALDRELTRAELAAILVRLFKLEPITGQSTFIDVPAEHWAQKEGVIEAVAKAGFMGSTTTYSKTFSPDAKLTIAEVATVAVRALGLTVDQNAKIDGVQPWAAPYVDAALKAQVISEATNYHANANRGILVDAAYTIYQAKLKPPVVNATKVESVSADNLLQVKVKFDGIVDEQTATDKGNYLINKGVKVVNASLSEDSQEVVLLLDTTAHLKNQEEFTLTYSGVKSGDGTVLSESNIKFTPVDASLPTVTKVEALGNKTIKVTFNEPVKNPSTSAFLIDGKTVLGNTNTAVNVVFLKVFTALSNEEHKISVSYVEDYSGLKSLPSEYSFTVVEDKEAPTVAEVVRATFDEVTLKFSEPVDPSTVKGNNVYWMQGSTKKPAGSVATQVSDDTFTFDFAITNNRIQYTTDLYVAGVQDYSGNVIANGTKIQVNPQLDLSRPEVLDVSVESAEEVIVKFNKRLDKDSAENAKNYVFKDAKGNEVNNATGAKKATLTDVKVVTITLNKPLDEGATYTLEISGVQDATFLKNTMIPYTTTIEVADETAPNLVSVIKKPVSQESDARTLVVTYDKAMATGGDGSVVDPTKYMYQTTENGVSRWNSIPSGTQFNVSSDASVVYITLPNSVTIAKYNAIDKLKVQLVKDSAGNFIDNLVQEKPATQQSVTTTVIQSVYAHSNTEIRLNFAETILADSLVARDFKVYRGTTELNVVDARVGGTENKVIYLTLADEDKLNDDATSGDLSTPVNVVVADNATTITPDGKRVINNPSTQLVGDKIKPSVKTFESLANNSVTITFKEELSSDVTGWENDLAVYVDGARKYYNTDYTISRSSNTTITITFNSPVSGSTVVVDAYAPAFIKDKIGNIAASFKGELFVK